MTEQPLSPQDQVDLDMLAGQGAFLPAPTHTVLEVWREVLSNIEGAEAEKPEPQNVTRITRSWPQIRVQDFPAYTKAYSDRLRDMRAIVNAEIDTDPKALERVENDGEENAVHYLNILLAWQTQVLEWELGWDVTAEDAHIQLASIAEAAGFVLSQQGLVGHLDQIQFSFTEADSALLGTALAEWKADQ